MEVEVERGAIDCDCARSRGGARRDAMRRHSGSLTGYKEFDFELMQGTRPCAKACGALIGWPLPNLIESSLFDTPPHIVS